MSTQHDDTYEAHYVRGRTLNRSKHYRAALESLDRALSMRPGDGHARAEMARALFHLGQRDEAWAILDDLLAEDMRSLASLVRAELLLETNEPELAAAVASKALRHCGPGETADGLRLARVNALLRAGHLTEAVQEVRAVDPATHGAAEMFDTLLDGLRRDRRWEDIVAIVDHRESTANVSPELLVRKVTALHALSRHDEALRTLTAIELDPRDTRLTRLKAVLLCDIGDFAGALDILKPATESSDAPDFLLSLRGWAHQHLTGPDHQEQAERMYREAHRKAPNDLWYREGLAHALQRLPGRQAEALREYDAVVKAVRERMRAEEVDAYTACLAGWCCYCLNRLSDAAAYYSAGLTMSRVGPAAEFDYAIILLALGYAADAQAQYERIVKDVAAINPLRRGGLLYVALFDLRDAIGVRPELDPIPETADIRRMLLGALRSASDEYQSSFPALAHQLQEFVEIEENRATRPPSRPAAGPTSEATNLAALAPGTPVVYLTPGAAECALLIPAASRLEGAVAVPLMVESAPRDFSDIRALYVTDSFLDTAGASRTEFPLESLVWHPLDTPAAASVAWTTASVGEKILNSLAVRLVRRAATHLARHGHSGSPVSRTTAVRAADLASKIAYDESLLYEAALIGAVASADAQSPDPAAQRGDVPQPMVRDAAGLRREARRRYSTEVTRHHEPAAADESSVHYKGSNEVVRTILTTAYEIAQISDPDEQARRARSAAAEVEALAPLHGSAARAREQVQKRLSSHDRFYLESDDSILVLARNPAFYSTNVLLNLSKPAVNCFAFASAARKLSGVRNPAARAPGRPSKP